MYKKLTLPKLENPKILGFIVLVIYGLFYLLGFNNPVPLEGDEIRYWDQSERILNGDLISGQYTEFISGPLFPCFLALIRLVSNDNILVLKILNLLPLVLGAYIFLSSALKRNFFPISDNSQKIFLLYFGVIFLTISSSWLKLLSENLSFLIIVLYWKSELSSLPFKHRSILFFLLILVKVIFLHVLLFSFLIHFITSRQPYLNLKFFIFVLILCLPWLAYSSFVQKSGIFYSNIGYKAIYQLTSRHKNDFGDFISKKSILENTAHPHYKTYKLIDDQKLNSATSGKLYLDGALENVVRNPLKSFSNFISGYSRFFFGYPTTGARDSQRGEFYPFFNKFLFSSFGSVSSFCCFILLVGRLLFYRTSYTIDFFDLILFSYILISGPIGGSMRQMLLVFPFLLLEFRNWTLQLNYLKIKV